MKDNNHEINETIKRTKRYWYVDGFSDISIGILMILIILFYYFTYQMSQPILKIILFAVGFPVLIILGNWIAGKVVSNLKEKYTYPRTGYVSYQRKTGSQRWKRVLLGIILGTIVGAVTSLFTGKLALIYQQLFVSIVIALCYTYIGYAIDLKRFYIYAGTSLMLFGIGTLVGAMEMDFFLLFFLGQGLAWIICGIFTLRNYLNATQPPAVDEP